MSDEFEQLKSNQDLLGLFENVPPDADDPFAAVADQNYEPSTSLFDMPGDVSPIAVVPVEKAPSIPIHPPNLSLNSSSANQIDFGLSSASKLSMTAADFPKSSPKPIDLDDLPPIDKLDASLNRSGKHPLATSFRNEDFTKDPQLSRKSSDSSLIEMDLGPREEPKVPASAEASKRSSIVSPNKGASNTSLLNVLSSGLFGGGASLNPVSSAVPMTPSPSAQTATSIQSTEPLQAAVTPQSVKTPQSLLQAAAITTPSLVEPVGTPSLSLFENLPESASQIATPHAPLPVAPPALHRTTTEKHAVSPALVSIAEEPFASDPAASLPTAKWLNPDHYREFESDDTITSATAKLFTPVEKPTRTSCLPSTTLRSSPDPLFQPIAEGSWKTVAILAKERLLSLNPDQVEEIQRLLALRWAAMSFLNVGDVAEMEMKSIGLDLKKDDIKSVLNGKEWNYSSWPSQFHGKTGSMVSVELRILFAKWPALRGNISDGINRLFKLLYNIKKNEGHTEAQTVVLVEIASLFLLVKEYKSALQVLGAIEAASVSPEQKATVLTYIGRTSLLMGDSKRARKSFEQAEVLLVGSFTSLSGEILPAHIQKHPLGFLMVFNHILMAIAEEQYALAQTLASAAVEAFPEYAHISATNYGVLCLYRGELSKAIYVIEKALNDMPQRTISSPFVCSDLSTLYDLKDRSLDKKKKLLGLLNRWGSDAFPVECLKLQ